MGKLAYANMKKQLRAIYDCSSNDFVSDEDAKVTINSCNRENNRGFYKRGSSYAKRREIENRRNGRRENPLNGDGNISRCKICESVNHCSTDCPEKRHEAEMSLFPNDTQECYMAEVWKQSTNCTGLDSGCSRTVCGDSWLKEFIESVNPVDAATII